MPSPFFLSFPSRTTIILSLLVLFTVQLGISDVMRFAQAPAMVLPALGAMQKAMSQDTDSTIDTDWYAPSADAVNTLNSVVDGTGTFGFIFSSSVLPEGLPYGTYNWCNMPHVRSTEYSRANSSFELVYVELIHRHHKRTPYAANTFPVENYPWYCNDSALYYYGSPLPVESTNHTAPSYWSIYTSTSNPLAPTGFNGTCQFPQITQGGLDDAHQHGLDIYSVYHTLLSFIPSTYDPTLISFRVTNNPITSQTISMEIPAYNPNQSTPLHVQPPTIDSLEPSYPCPFASNLYATFATGSTSPAWTAHLTQTHDLVQSLDAISGIPPFDIPWHQSYDHYFDTLSSRLCHDRPLPCSTTNSSHCITQEQANAVFRLGEYEYAYTYRAAGPETLRAAVGRYGIFVAELAQNLRFKAGLADDPAVVGEGEVRLRHNVAHDGSVAALLAILQVEGMVWPGMGAEVVFELFLRREEGGRGYFVRVLFGGQVVRSSSPTLGVMDMLPVETVLGYFDGLVGVGASKIPGICNG